MVDFLLFSGIAVLMAAIIIEGYGDTFDLYDEEEGEQEDEYW